jgi:murein DD-endopeptidase MepM/ murein hydrolase activator NlpD
VRRHLPKFFAAALLAIGGLLGDVTIGPLAGTAQPAGAVLPASATAQPTSTTASAPEGPGASPTSRPTTRPPATPVGLPARAEPAEAPGLLGDGPHAPSPRLLTGYRWPLANGVVTGPFGPSPLGAVIVGGGRFHDGLDIASFCGDRVVAAHDGLVLAAGRKFDPFIGWIGSLGPHTRRMNRLGLWWELPITVIIDDGDGYRAIYAHLNAVSVKPGQWVRAGHQIGWEGATGFATGCHVHFGLFSPLETRRFELRPDVVGRTKYPRWEVARIDPQLVLPPLPKGRTTGPFPTPTPSPATLRQGGPGA